MIETLESRIAPATLLPGGRGFTYTDIDGDFVTVKFSKPVVAEPAIRDAVTIFAGGPNWGQNTTPENLLTLDLTKAGSAALIAGLDITITAQPRGTGDGYVHMLGIAARNDMPAVGDVAGDLGRVKVDGWLNFFFAGDATQTPKTQAVKLLEVQGLGDQFENQPVTIVGSLGALNVKGNVTSAISVLPPAGFSFTDVTIGKITIGGSLLAGVQGTGGTLDLVAKTTGSLAIGGNVQGGAAAGSGTVETTGEIKSVVIRGSILGGAGADSGGVQVASPSVKIGGSVIGGSGPSAGRLSATGNGAGAVTVGGSVLGGAGGDSGVVFFAYGKAAALTIGGDVSTALSPNAGYLAVLGGGGGKITVGGSLINRVESVFSTVGNVFRAGGSIHVIPSMTDGAIDSITVGGTLRGGNIVGNVLAGVDGFFGTADDVKEQPLRTIGIGRVVVKGGFEPVSLAGFFGVVADDFKTVQLGRLTLTDATPGIGVGVAIGSKVRVREI